MCVHLKFIIDLRIFYRPGIANRGADFLSRMHPLPGSEMVYESKKLEVKVGVQAVSRLTVSNAEDSYWLKKQLQDPILSLVHRLLAIGLPGASENVRLLAKKCEVRWNREMQSQSPGMAGSCMWCRSSQV